MEREKEETPPTETNAKFSAWLFLDYCVFALLFIIVINIIATNLKHFAHNSYVKNPERKVV